MSTTTKDMPTLLDAYRSTFVELGTDNRPERITTHPRFLTVWRGQPAVVTMASDRYRRADGNLTDWRTYASEAREYQPNVDAPHRATMGPHLTETARRRLSDVCHPFAVAWLASPGFHAEYRRALVDAIARYGEKRYQPWQEIRAATDMHRAVIGADAARLLRRYADSLERADAAVEAIHSHTRATGSNHADL